MDETPEQTEARHRANDERHEADEQRHILERQREEASHLRDRYNHYTTADLQIMHNLMHKTLFEPGGHDLNLTLNPLQRKIWGDSDSERMDKLIDIDRELLRRWKTGDKEAFLPEFNTPTQVNP